MQRKDLVAALRAWGHATVNRFAVCRADRSVHALDKARDLAPGTRERAVRALVGRDGTDRRRAMARAAGIKQLTILPKWSCEPIRAANDADRPHDNPEIAHDQGIPDELRWLDSAIAQMQRQYPMRAMIVRTEFTVAAGQRAKARMVSEQYGGALSVWQYRAELERAMAWIVGARDAA